MVQDYYSYKNHKIKWASNYTFTQSLYNNLPESQNYYGMFTFNWYNMFRADRDTNPLDGAKIVSPAKGPFYSGIELKRAKPNAQADLLSQDIGNYISGFTGLERDTRLVQGGLISDGAGGLKDDGSGKNQAIDILRWGHGISRTPFQEDSLYQMIVYSEILGEGEGKWHLTLSTRVTGQDRTYTTINPLYGNSSDSINAFMYILYIPKGAGDVSLTIEPNVTNKGTQLNSNKRVFDIRYFSKIVESPDETTYLTLKAHHTDFTKNPSLDTFIQHIDSDDYDFSFNVVPSTDSISAKYHEDSDYLKYMCGDYQYNPSGGNQQLARELVNISTGQGYTLPGNAVELNAAGFDKLKRGDFTELKQKITSALGDDVNSTPPLIVYEGYLKKAILLNRIINTPSIMYTMNITMRSTNRKIEYAINDQNTIYINNDAFMFDLWNVDSQIYWRVPVELIQANPSVFGKKFTLSNFGHGTGGTDLPVTLTSVSGNSATFSSAVGNSTMPDGSTAFIESGIDGKSTDANFYGFSRNTFYPSSSSSLKHNAPYTNTDAVDFISAGLPMYQSGSSASSNSGMYAYSVASLLHNQYDQKKKNTADKNTLNANITNTTTKASDDVFNFYVASPPFSNYSAVARTWIDTTQSVTDSARNKKIWKPTNFDQFGGLITDVEKGVAINLDMIPLIMQDLNNGIIQYYFAHGHLYKRTLQSKDGTPVTKMNRSTAKTNTNLVKSTLLTGSTGDSEVLYVSPSGKGDNETSYDTISFKIDTSQNSSATTILDDQNVRAGFFLRGRKYHRHPNDGTYTDAYWYTDNSTPAFIDFDERDNTLELVNNLKREDLSYTSVTTSDFHSDTRGYGLYYNHIPDYPSHTDLPKMDQPNSQYAGKFDFSNGETKVVNIECRYIPQYGNKTTYNIVGLTIFQYLDDLYNSPTKFSVRRSAPKQPATFTLTTDGQTNVLLSGPSTGGTGIYALAQPNGGTSSSIEFKTDAAIDNAHDTIKIDAGTLNKYFNIQVSNTNVATGKVVQLNHSDIVSGFSDYIFKSIRDMLYVVLKGSQSLFLDSYFDSGRIAEGSTPVDINLEVVLHNAKNMKNAFDLFATATNNQSIDYYDAYSDNFFTGPLTVADTVRNAFHVADIVDYYVGYDFSKTPPTGLINPPSNNYKQFDPYTVNSGPRSVQIVGPWNQNPAVSTLADSYLTLRLYAQIQRTGERIPLNPQDATAPMAFQTTIKVPGGTIQIEDVSSQIEILPDTAILVNQRAMTTFVGNGASDHINSPTNYFIRFPIKDYNTNTSKYKDYVKYTNTVKYDASKSNKESFSGKKVNMVWYGINYFTHALDDIATAPAQIITNDVYIHDGFVYTVNKEGGVSLDGHTLFYFKLMDAQTNDIVYQSPIYYEAMTLSKFGTGTHFIAMRYPYELVKYAGSTFGKKFSISHMVNGESNSDIWVSINDINTKTRTLTESDGIDTYTINQTYREYTVTASGVGTANDEDALDLNTLRIGGTIVPNRIETDGNYFIINARPADGSVTSVLEGATNPNASDHAYRATTSIINEDYDDLVDEVYSNFVTNYSGVTNGSNTIIEEIADPDNNTASMFITYGVFNRDEIYKSNQMQITDYRPLEDTTGSLLSGADLDTAFNGSPFVNSTSSQFPHITGKKLEATANVTIPNTISLNPGYISSVTYGKNDGISRYIVILFKTNDPDFVVSNLLPTLTNDKVFSVKTKDSLMFVAARVPSQGSIVIFNAKTVVPAGRNIELIGMNIVDADKPNNAVYSAFYNNQYAGTVLKFPQLDDRFHFFKPETLTISAQGNTSGTKFVETSTSSTLTIQPVSEDYTVSLKGASGYDLSAVAVNLNLDISDPFRKDSFVYTDQKNPLYITSILEGGLSDGFNAQKAKSPTSTVPTVQSFVPNTPYSTLFKLYKNNDSGKTIQVNISNIYAARIPSPMVSSVMNMPPAVSESVYNQMPTTPKSTGALEMLDGSAPTVYIHDFLEYSTINPDMAAIIPPVEVLTDGPEVDNVSVSDEGYDIISIMKGVKTPIPKIKNVVIPEKVGKYIPFGISGTVTNNTRKEIMFTPNGDSVSPDKYPVNPFGQETILNDVGTYEITTQYDMQEIRMGRLGTLGTKVSSPEYKVEIEYYKGDSLSGTVPPVIETIQNVGNAVTVNITFDKDNVGDHYHYTGWIIKDGGTPQVLFDNDSTINNAISLTRTYGPYTEDGSYEVLVEYSTEVNNTSQYVSKDFIIDSNMQHGESGNYDVPNDPDNIPLAKDYPFPANWWAHDSYADDINAYANDAVYKPVRANKNTNPYNYGLTTISIFGHKYAYMEKDPIINYNIFENGTFNFNTYTLENPTYTSHIHGIGERYIINGASWKTDGMGSLTTNDFDITKDASRHLHPYTSKATDSVHTDTITLLEQENRPRVPEYVASSDTALPPFKSHDVMPLAATDDIKFRLTNKSKGYDVQLFIDGYPYTEDTVYTDPGTHYFYAVYKDKHNYLASYSEPQKFIIEKEHRYSPPYIDYAPKKQYSEFYDVTIDYYYYDTQLGITEEELDLDELSRPRVKSTLYRLGDNDTWHNYAGPFRITKPVNITARKVYTDNFFFDVNLDIDMNKISYDIPKTPVISDISQPNVYGGGLAVYIPTVEKKLGFSYREWLNGVPYTAGTPVTNYERNRRHFWYTVEITDNMTQEKNKITKHFDIDTRTPERPRFAGLVQGMIKRVDPSYKLTLLNRESGVTYKYQINGQALDITKPLGDYANGRFDKVYKIIAQAIRTDNGMTNTSYYYIEINQAIDDSLYNSGKALNGDPLVPGDLEYGRNILIPYNRDSKSYEYPGELVVDRRTGDLSVVSDIPGSKTGYKIVDVTNNISMMLRVSGNALGNLEKIIPFLNEKTRWLSDSMDYISKNTDWLQDLYNDLDKKITELYNRLSALESSADNNSKEIEAMGKVVENYHYIIMNGEFKQAYDQLNGPIRQQLPALRASYLELLTRYFEIASVESQIDFNLRDIENLMKTKLTGGRFLQYEASFITALESLANQFKKDISSSDWKDPRDYGYKV